MLEVLGRRHRRGRCCFLGDRGGGLQSEVSQAYQFAFKAWADASEASKETVAVAIAAKQEALEAAALAKTEALQASREREALMKAAAIDREALLAKLKKEEIRGLKAD